MKFTTSPTMQSELQPRVQNLQRIDSAPRWVNVTTLCGLRHLLVLIVFALQRNLRTDIPNLTTSALAVIGNVLGYGYTLRQGKTLGISVKASERVTPMLLGMVSALLLLGTANILSCVECSWCCQQRLQPCNWHCS